MRPIRWLHISDIHMEIKDAWSHDVVLRALCDDIAQKRAAGVLSDFILVTGDIAFSGKADEYRLAEMFFDALSLASGVPKDRIFLIAGNHDVDRDRQRMCFQGTRYTLASPNQVDAFLVPGEELQTLLNRQEQYRRFLGSYCQGQERISTPDGLAYVSLVVVDDVRLAIVGLNSAWLAEGGSSDHGKLIIGERQVIDALEAAKKLDPHVVIAMAHHPLHLLQEFDRASVQRRIEGLCRFLHCGHLHEPETHRVSRAGPDCLTVMAGASYETRHSRNSYSIITLDLMQAKRTIQTVEYKPRSGAFGSAESEEYPIEITPTGKCQISELADAITRSIGSLSGFNYYLSALLLDAKSDVPIPGQSGYVFGSFAVLQAQPDSELKSQTVAFKALTNVLRVFFGRMPLPEIFGRYGDAVAQYEKLLQKISRDQPEIGARLASQEEDAKSLAGAMTTAGGSRATDLLDDLARTAEWHLLRDFSERYVNSPEWRTAVHAKRMMALSLAHSEDATDKRVAIDIYRSLTRDGLAGAEDVACLATLLAEAGDADEAKDVLLGGIKKFGNLASSGFYDIGLRIVEATGDREFRSKLDEALATRGKRG